jgi:hypothetical protein
LFQVLIEKFWYLFLLTDKFTNTKLTISILIISIITIFFTSEIVEKQTEENQIKNFTKKFEDEIEPYCKGSLEVTNYKQFSDIESLDINLFDQREWYLNLFNVIKDEGRFIENKYKNRFSGVVLVKFKNGTTCSFNSRIRISGDWRDHINENRLISSMDVSLDEGNIFGITKFKLLIRTTRGSNNGKDEVFATTLLRNVGYISPRTALLDVNVNQKGKETFIFQEKHSKEIIEFHNYREGPILETYEDFFWQTSSGIPFDNFEKTILFGKILNKKWAYQSLNNLQIASEALHAFNLSIFNSYNPASQLNYKYLSKDQSDLYGYDLLNFALNAEHGITNHNRSFYFNKISQSFEPIYYDGNVKFTDSPELKVRDDYKEIQNLATYSNLLIKKLEKINVTELTKELKFNNFDTNENEINKIIQQIIENTKSITEYNYNKDFEESTNYLFETENKNINFVFLDFKKLNIEICNQYLNNCFIVDESKFNLDSIIDIVEQENYYLFGINKLDFINKPKNYFLDSNYETLVLDDNLIVNLYNNPKLEVSYADGKKEIFIEISDVNQKVLFTSLNKDYGELFNWNIYANSSNKQFNEIRQDSNLLTGCISFYNIKFLKTNIDSKNMMCEDSVNIIRSIGNINKIHIENSKFDGLDIDYSIISIEDITITNSDNDCADFSSGQYEIINFKAIECKDKGLSIGEKSKIKLDFADIQNSFIGIAVKDSSTVISNKFVNFNLEYCFALYRKKQEFAGGLFEISSENCKENQKYTQFGSIFNVGS